MGKITGKKSLPPHLQCQKYEMNEVLEELSEQLLEVVEEMKTCSHTQGLVRVEDEKDVLIFFRKVTLRQERRCVLSVSSARNVSPAPAFVRPVLNHDKKQQC